MADRAQQQSDLLNGWKEIAEFLEVDKSTAQRWAKTRGLPVRYLPGPKSRVVASASDLDAWRLAGPAVAPPEPLDDGGNLATSAIGKHSAPVQPPTRRRWLGYAVAGCGGVGLTVLGIGAARLYFFRNQRPNAYRVEGATLIVSGVSGAELWRHTFEGQLSEEAYQSSQGPKKCIFSDVDGDGHTETLFSFIGRDVHSERSLYCFDSAGRVRWRFTPGRTVVDNLNRTWSPPYLITAFEVVDSRKSKTKSVVVSSVHNYSFPTQVALLDGKTGRLLSDYWHRGHLLHLAIADLDGDGEPEILLGGVNDALEHRQATLVVFDQHNLSGSSRNPQGKTYFKDWLRARRNTSYFFQEHRSTWSRSSTRWRMSPSPQAGL